ncbi:class I SAM-dependent methyltransferase [Paracidovorax anthurii]|uniref:Methyltransferase family protein n=1 Tax=Paracidovorax anthurii TaxID=78229 RepID=A0A328Z5F5_9BURK|nr:methyltransferase family protein [Paracidovorax anthurii]
MISLLDRIQQRFWGPPQWDAAAITDEWFRAHFHYAADVVQHWLGSAMDLRTARLLNFGCGDGITDLALVLRHGATSIHGIDIRQEYAKLPRIAREQLGLRRVPKALGFETIRPAQPLAGRRPVDGIFSWSTFEHVSREQLEPIARDLYEALNPGGFFFLQIEPLYYSPFGSHLRRYDDVPWHHLLASDDELWSIIQAHEGPIDGAERDFGFDDFGVEGYKKFVFNEYRTLNRLTADELVALMERVGFRVARQERRSVQMEIPQALRGKYPDELLLNNEIFLLLAK